MLKQYIVYNNGRSHSQAECTRLLTGSGEICHVGSNPTRPTNLKEKWMGDLIDIDEYRKRKEKQKARDEIMQRVADAEDATEAVGILSSLGFDFTTGKDSCDG